MIMNTCEKTQFELATLDQSESTPIKVRQHLAICQKCKAFAFNLAKQNQLMEDLIYPQIPNWPEFIDQGFIKTPVTVHKFGIASPSSSRRERLFGKIAMTVALSASLMVAVGGWLIGPYLGTFAYKGPREVTIFELGRKQPVAGANKTDSTLDPSPGLPPGAPSAKSKGDAPAAPKETPFPKPIDNTKGFGSLTRGPKPMNPNGPPTSPVDPKRFDSPLNKEQKKGLGESPELIEPNHSEQKKIEPPDMGFAILPPTNQPAKTLGDLDIEKKLKLAKNPGLQVQFVQNLFHDQYNAVQTQLSMENLARNQPGNQLSDQTGSFNNQNKKLKAFEKGNTENGNTQKGNTEGRKNPASETNLGRNLQHAETPWEGLIQGQKDLVDNSLVTLKKLLPSPSNAKDLEPLVKDLRKQKEDYLRQASLNPQHGEALKKLADLAQMGLGILGDSKEGKPR